MRTRLQIPTGQWLYGIRTHDGQYLRAVGADLKAAARSAGVSLDRIKRSMPLKSGDAQAEQRRKLEEFLKTRKENEPCARS